MKDRIKKFFKITDEDMLMIVLALVCFSFGIWFNYRQLWLQSIGFTLSQISRVLSVALICSAIISFVISLFSTRVKVKYVILLALILRSSAMALLLLNSNTYIIKTCMLICSMCEVIFSIAFYPLLSTVNKSAHTYRKHSLINYLGKDAGIISCGLLIGVVVGNRVFDYNSCLFIAMISTILASLVLLLFRQNKTITKRNVQPLKKALKKLYKSKINNYYLFTQFVMNISYGIMFGLMMLILTDYIKFSVSTASIFIIVSNLIGSLACSLLIKYGTNISIRLSIFLKYGTRVLGYLTAFIVRTPLAFVIAVFIPYVSARILEDKINGTYIRRIDTNSQFLFGNIRYFVLSLGEGIGTYLAGYLIQISFESVFLGAAVCTILQIIMFLNLDYMRKKDELYVMEEN